MMGKKHWRKKNDFKRTTPFNRPSKNYEPQNLSTTSSKNKIQRPMPQQVSNTNMGINNVPSCSVTHSRFDFNSNNNDSFSSRDANIQSFIGTGFDPLYKNNHQFRNELDCNMGIDNFKEFPNQTLANLQKKNTYLDISLNQDSENFIRQPHNFQEMHSSHLNRATDYNYEELTKGATSSHVLENESFSNIPQPGRDFTAERKYDIAKDIIVREIEQIKHSVIRTGENSHKYQPMEKERKINQNRFYDSESQNRNFLKNSSKFNNWNREDEIHYQSGQSEKGYMYPKNAKMPGHLSRDQSPSGNFDGMTYARRDRSPTDRYNCRSSPIPLLKEVYMHNKLTIPKDTISRNNLHLQPIKGVKNLFENYHERSNSQSMNMYKSMIEPISLGRCNDDTLGQPFPIPKKTSTCEYNQFYFQPTNNTNEASHSSEFANKRPDWMGNKPISSNNLEWFENKSLFPREAKYSADDLGWNTVSRYNSHPHESGWQNEFPEDPDMKTSGMNEEDLRIHLLRLKQQKIEDQLEELDKKSQETDRELCLLESKSFLF